MDPEQNYGKHKAVSYSLSLLYQRFEQAISLANGHVFLISSCDLIDHISSSILERQAQKNGTAERGERRVREKERKRQFSYCQFCNSLQPSLNQHLTFECRMARTICCKGTSAKQSELDLMGNSKQLSKGYKLITLLLNQPLCS